MSKFSKITIFIFLTLVMGGSFMIFSDVFADSAAGSVYVCPNATSSAEVNPRCPGKVILKLGETINGMTLTTTIYNGEEYYTVFGFTNGGGGVNLPPKANSNGPYQGDAGLPITFDAGNSSDPNNDPLRYRWDFNNDGTWDTKWLSASTVNHIWNNDYEGVVELEVSDGEFAATDITSIIVKSPRTFKKEAISELKKAKTNKGKIAEIIRYIQNSLDDNLWIDTSHLVFLEKDCSDPKILELNPDKIDLEELFELDSEKLELKMKDAFKGKCFKPGLKVFQEEYIATLMLKTLGGKPFIPAIQAIAKLVKADQLLAKIAILDAKNTPIQNPEYQKKVKYQIKKAKEELAMAEKEISQGKPNTAIIRLSKSWLYAQLAIQLANLK